MRRKKIIAILAAILVVVILLVSLWGGRKYVNRQAAKMAALEHSIANDAEASKKHIDLDAQLQQLEGRLNAVETRLLSQEGPGLGDRLPLAGDYRGSSAPVFSLFDAVGPYRKNGLFEVYGGSFRERRSGPIHVNEADFEITHDDAWLIWSPDFSPARDATHLLVEFVVPPNAGKLNFGFILNDGQLVSYEMNAGTPTVAAKGLLPPLLPDVIVTKASSVKVTQPLQLTGNKAVVALPPKMVLTLRNGQPKSIAQWFVRATGSSNTTLRFKQLSLVRPMPAPTSAGVTVAGYITKADLPPGTQVELLSETGAVLRQAISTDGGFSFAGIDPERPISLRVKHPLLLHYATLGRWFVPGYSRSDISIDLKPIYENNDGHAPDQSKARFVSPRVPSPDSALYEPHARQYWPGAGALQEYDSTTFTNNHGYLDRDRFFDNPENCVRLASTGGSDMVALQVRPQEKFNILLEETLGIALGKCVEVISAGADNGDLGVNYPRIRDYTSKFKVSHTLVSMAASLVQQVNPQMLRDGLGLDPENSSLPNFYYDKDGKFTFRTASPVYPVFMTKPTYPEYAKGIRFAHTLSVPFEVMPTQGKDAFKYWTEIVNYIGKNNPGQHFIFHTGVDQAQCRKNCKTTITLADGKKVPAGAKIYAENLTKYCNKSLYNCINPQFSANYADRPNLLTFEFDGHYSILGHQWLARELTAPIAKLFPRASN